MNLLGFLTKRRNLKAEVSTITHTVADTHRQNMWELQSIMPQNSKFAAQER
jgi:hypothetical protein